ncbi:MAG: phosphate ABC transporter permease PstA [Rhizobiaceae bacterium]|nr:phosphate ABC transporter permease PstA [Rhizobiaceae bacterium]
MTDVTLDSLPVATAPARRDIGIRKRYAAERRFRFYGLAAISVGLIFLAVMLVTIVGKGYTSFMQTSILLPITFDAKVIDPQNKRETDPSVLIKANYPNLARDALATRLGISKDDKPQIAALKGFVSDGVRVQLRDMVVADPSLIGQTRDVWVLAGANIDSAFKGQIDLDVAEGNRKVSDRQVGFIDKLRDEGVMEGKFNTGLFTYGASSRPETSGVGVAIIGSFYMMLIVLLLALPIGVAASIYLEEFAKKSRLTDIIEVNINNLAAVPSIVFGLLGLAIFLNFFGLPRSAPLVGGLVLALLVLPTIIIASRAALKAVPPSIREAALGVGASKQQAVFHHVLPLAMPGILTGTIIGMAHALGETAPLLLIGMVAFIVDVPHGVTDAATVLPVQIFLWSDLPEVGFQAKTSAAIIVLLAFLLIMNGAAILLRKRFERRW